MKTKKLMCLFTTACIFAGLFLNIPTVSSTAPYNKEPKIKIGDFSYIFSENVQYGSVKIPYSATVVEFPNIQKVELPSKVTYNGNEYTVTDIRVYGGYYVIKNNSELLRCQYPKIEEIVLPDTIYNITALDSFSNLKRINIPKNTVIRRNKKYFTETYYYDPELTGGLSYCPNLKLSLDPENPYYSYKNDMLLSKDGKTLFISFKSEKNIEIPDGVETVLDRGGYGFESVENVKFPNTLKYIGDYAFYNSKITKITFPNSVKKIKDSAFLNSDLKKIKFGKNLTYIGMSAFRNCKGLKTITLPKKLKTIDYYAFEKCKNLKQVKILSNNIVIQYEAFAGCRKLTKITMDGAKKIETEAFRGCRKLSKVKIGNKRKAPKIEKRAFKNTKKGIKFYVRNKKVAKSLKKQLTDSGVKNAKILVGKKIIYNHVK